MKKGFTLIELLVVVIIIGVLTAIAIPMYEKSVDRTRITEALVWVKTTSDSVQRALQEKKIIDAGDFSKTYVMGTAATGQGTIDSLRLDINPMPVKSFNCYIVSYKANAYGVISRCEFKDADKNKFVLLRSILRNGSGKTMVCAEYATGEDYEGLCNNIGFQKEGIVDEDKDPDCYPANTVDSAPVCWKRA